MGRLFRRVRRRAERSKPSELWDQVAIRYEIDELRAQLDNGDAGPEVARLWYRMTTLVEHQEKLRQTADHIDKLVLGGNAGALIATLGLIGTFLSKGQAPLPLTFYVLLAIFVGGCWSMGLALWFRYLNEFAHYHASAEKIELLRRAHRFHRARSYCRWFGQSTLVIGTFAGLAALFSYTAYWPF